MVLRSASKWGESVENGFGMQDFPEQLLTLREGQARMTLLVLCSHNVQPNRKYISESSHAVTTQQVCYVRRDVD